MRRAITMLSVALIAAACTAKGAATPDGPLALSRPTTSTMSTSTTTTTTTTTVAPKPTPPPPPPGLGRGSRGEEVMALERRLNELHYDVGAIDGLFDANTGHAVMAFQKVHGMARTSRATPDVLDRLAAAPIPGELVPGGGVNRVEIDLKRQVLFLYRHGALLKILPVSTGNGKRYCVEGDCAIAVTPGGSFRVKRYISGWRESRLGLLYNPLYFNGGIAIHGSKSVPGYPASHGCVRIPMFAAGWFPQQVALGTPVYVHGGPRAPVPFNEPTPGEATTTTSSTSSSTTAPPETTSTTSPSTTTTTTAVPAPTTTVVP